MPKAHIQWLQDLLKANPFRDFSWIRTEVLLSTLTTFKVGGACDIVIEPPTKEDLLFILDSLRSASLDFLVLGRGSNVVACDEGYPGIILHLSDTMNAISVREEDGASYITAEAGASLAALSKTALANGLTGLEFASGIPGTVGGGLYMNAGAYGGELSKVLLSCEVVTSQGEVKVIPKEDLAMGYRSTRFMNEDWIILSGTFLLKKGDKEAIRDLMQDLNQRRRDKQPLEYPSAGSFFKRPEGYFAGKLIEDAGLKGTSVGGAMVSPKHAGFLINTGKASAKDVEDLMHLVQDKVAQDFGVHLEAEVKYLSREGFVSWE